MTSAVSSTKYQVTAATIGLTVTLLISLVGPLTMACFNPARALAPRLFSALAGWGGVPFRVNGAGWWAVYIVAPVLGGLLGGGVYTACFKRAYREIQSLKSKVGEGGGPCREAEIGKAES